MTDPIVIRKYENRRLYDTHNSRHVNLDGVAELVRAGRDVQVIDSKSGEDVTRHVLAQIIVEDAKHPEHGPPLEFLRDLVRARDQAGRDFLQWYLKSAGEVYARVRETMRGNPFAPDPSWMRLWDPRAIAEAMHTQMTRQRGRAFGSTSKTADGAGAAQPPAPRKAAARPQEAGGSGAARAELDELRQRLQDLERRLTDAAD